MYVLSKQELGDYSGPAEPVRLVQRATIDNNGQQWTTMDNNGHQWTTMDNNGQQWILITMDNN